jgi:hypothetical protein
MSHYVIAIPSHKRSNTIRKNTLSVLDFYEIDKKLIHVFVAPEEVSKYEAELPEYRIVASALGLDNQRNFIREFFPEDEKILYLDDDISGFIAICDQNDHSTCAKFNKGADDYVKQIQIVDLKLSIEALFTQMLIENVYLGGIYPVANGFFMTHKSSTKLSYIVGCCYAEINKKDEKYILDQSYGEDYLRTLIHFTNNGIVRLNWLAPQTTYFKGSGGLNDERTIPNFLTALEKIHNRFPNLCKVRTIENKYSKLFLHAYK